MNREANYEWATRKEEAIIPKFTPPPVEERKAWGLLIAIHQAVKGGAKQLKP